MRRDMDLIRQIMFKVEEQPGGYAPNDFTIEGHSQDEVLYHVWLLGDAGWMKVSDASYMGSSGPQALPVSLTSAGHDFIDAARNNTTWTKAKEKVAAIGGSVTLAILKQVLDSILKAQLGL
jgi:Hypothetical protein (DUF2513)